MARIMHADPAPDPRASADLQTSANPQTSRTPQTSADPQASAKGMANRLGGKQGAVLLFVAMLLIALTLRAPITSLPPVIEQFSASLGLTNAQAGLLTSIPILCFALLTPVASALIGKVGIRWAGVAALAAMLLGQLIRSGGSTVLAFLGTVVIGAGIAIGNVTIPVIIAQHFQSRSALATGAFSAVMNLGAALAMAATAPLAILWGWQWALVWWGVLALAALAVWVYANWFSPVAAGTRSSAMQEPVAPPQPTPMVKADSVVEPVRRSAPWRSQSPQHHEQARELSAQSATETTLPSSADSLRRAQYGATSSTTRTRDPMGRAFLTLTILLGVGFAGQVAAYYAVTAWLPAILTDRLGVGATAAGGMSMPLQLLGLAGSLGVPLLLGRKLPLKWLVAMVVLAWVALPIGLLLAPHLAVVWILLAGAAQGGNYTLILSLIAQRAPSVAAARRSSAAVQTAGYMCAAATPPLMGIVNDATGSWTIPLYLVLGFLILMAVAMFLATSVNKSYVNGS